MPTEVDSGCAESNWAMIPRSGLAPGGCFSNQRTRLLVSSDRLAIVAWSGRELDGLVSKTSRSLGPTPCRGTVDSLVPNRLVHHVASPSVHASVAPPPLDRTTLTIGFAASRSETSSRARATWAGLKPLEMPPTIKPNASSKGGCRDLSAMWPSRAPFHNTDQ